MAIIEVHGQGGDALQQAVNSAVDGDTIQVWGDPSLPYSGITVSKSLTIVGINGRDNCVIDGGHTYNEETDKHTGTRCVNGATKSKHTIKSFTLQNGGNGAFFGGCICAFTLDDCVIKSGYAPNGGGAYNCDIENSIIEYCTATGNGGGVFSCTVTNSIIRNNTATGNGGGANASPLTDCEVYGNTSPNYGAGTFRSKCINCFIHDNLNDSGTYEQALYGEYINCLVYGNVQLDAIYSTTIISDNKYCVYNGGNKPPLKNCVFYFVGADGSAMKGHNTTDRTNYDNCLFYPSVSNLVDKPSILNGVDPMLTPDYHLRKGSPCIGAGNAEYLQSATDLDGKAWKTPPSIGCYEFYGSKQFLPSSLHPLGV